MPLNISGSVVTDVVAKSMQTTNIVKRGLVLHLDAASTSSYPGTGTGWYDLTGNLYNGILTNGPTYSSNNGGYIVFDGTNDYVTTADVNHGTSEFTLEVWVYFNAFSSYNCIMKKNTDNEAWPVFSMYVESNGTFRGLYSSQVFGACLESAISSTANISTNQWYHLCYSKGAAGYTTMKLHKNGVSQAYSNSLYGSHINEVCNSSKPVLIGVEYDNDAFIRHVNGRISVARIYNRQLSDAEILQNYNIQKGRFGL
jgi:hypothetical protein